MADHSQLGWERCLPHRVQHRSRRVRHLPGCSTEPHGSRADVHCSRAPECRSPGAALAGLAVDLFEKQSLLSCAPAGMRRALNQQQSAFLDALTLGSLAEGDRPRSVGRPSEGRKKSLTRRPRSRRWSARNRPWRSHRARPRPATHEDKRHGTISLYVALDIASGQVFGEVIERHRMEQVSPHGPVA
jgi:hypothetical protein